MSIFDLIENTAAGDEPLTVTAQQCREAMEEFWAEVNEQRRNATDRLRKALQEVLETEP